MVQGNLPSQGSNTALLQSLCFKCLSALSNDAPVGPRHQERSPTEGCDLPHRRREAQGRRQSGEDMGSRELISPDIGKLESSRGSLVFRR